MKSQLIHQDQEKTYVLILDEGDEAMTSLTRFARENHLSASQFTAIGAFRKVVTGFFDFSIKEYHPNRLDEQVEVLALTGDISLHDNEPTVHAHVVVGKADGTAHGGHLLEGHVHPTLEVIITETPAHLHRKTDKKTGLALIDLDASGS